MAQTTVRTAPRAPDRAEVERLLERAVAEEGKRIDAGVLLGRGRAALEDLAAPAAEEYAAYLAALEAAHTGHRTRRSRADACYALTGDRRGEAWTQTQQARARLLRGEPTEAVRLLNEALAPAGPTG